MKGPQEEVIAVKGAGGGTVDELWRRRAQAVVRAL